MQTQNATQLPQPINTNNWNRFRSLSEATKLRVLSKEKLVDILPA